MMRRLQLCENLQGGWVSLATTAGVPILDEVPTRANDVADEEVSDDGSDAGWGDDSGE